MHLERVLKAGLRRSVRLERASDGARSVVKRFASKGFAAASLDRARAAREHRMLSELLERGVSVPRPLGVAQVDGGIAYGLLAGILAANFVPLRGDDDAG